MPNETLWQPATSSQPGNWRRWMIFNSDGTYYFADSTFNFDGQLTYGTAAPAVPFTYFNDSLNAMATHSRIHINGDQLLIIEPGQVSGVEHIYYKRQ